jgi:peptide/nickel transport system ATP-binding protein
MSVENDPFVRVHDLSIDIPVANGILHAVRDVSFEIQKGQTLCIVGESGSGKSMLALGIIGLLPHRATRVASEISFGGVDLQNLSRSELSMIRGRRVAMIFQEPMTSLNPCYTIGDQMIEMAVRHLQMGVTDAQDCARMWLEKVGIPASSERLKQYPHQLSGGLRQRVMIAMMLMCEPELIIADEPTTALDVTIQAQVLHVLSSLQHELGLTMLFITHDLGVVSRIADQIAVMYAGSFVEIGSAQAVLDTPQHPYTRGLLDCIPGFSTRSRDGKLGTISGAVPSLIGVASGCAFSNRCPNAVAECTQGQNPEPRVVGNQYVRCLMPKSSLILADH